MDKVVAAAVAMKDKLSTHDSVPAKETPTAPAPPAPEPVPVKETPIPVPVPEAAAPAPEPPVKEIPAPEPVPETEVPEKKPAAEDSKVAESVSFKEETNIVADLPNPQQKALDELRELVKSALEKHEFTAPPPPPAKEVVVAEPEAPVEEKKESDDVVIESKPEEEKKKESVEVVIESKPVEKKEPAEEKKKPVEEKKETPSVEEKKETAPVEEKKETAPVEEKKKPEEKKVEVPASVKEGPSKVAEPKVEEKKSPLSAIVDKVAAKVEKVIHPKAEEKTEQKVEAAEEIKETIVEVTTSPPPPAPEAAVEEKTKEEVPEPEAEATPPPPPEEVSIWGIKLLEDDKSDAILLKFLRARDFKVKEAFAMLKSVVQWRKEFGIDSLIEEETTCEGLDKVVYLHGVDKEGHLVLYNSFGEFQDKELYQNTFADAEKRTKFLRGIIQLLEKTIRGLDFTPDGLCTLFQVIDLKNSPGLFFFKKDLRQAISHALQLFQDNYPEFVAKQVYINVPWWFRAYYSMINAIFSPRTKSKFIFAGPSRSAEILFKYIAPENVPVRYGGLSKESESEFASDTATEVIIKPTSNHTIEFEITEKCTLVWELRVVGGDVSYGAEFVPSAEAGYTVIIQKTRKVGPTDEPIISSSYTTGEPGKVILTVNNQTSKRKNLVYRSKNKSLD